MPIEYRQKVSLVTGQFACGAEKDDESRRRCSLQGKITRYRLFWSGNINQRDRRRYRKAKDWQSKAGRIKTKNSFFEGYVGEEFNGRVTRKLTWVHLESMNKKRQVQNPGWEREVPILRTNSKFSRVACKSRPLLPPQIQITKLSSLPQSSSLVSPPLPKCKKLLHLNHKNLWETGAGWCQTAVSILSLYQHPLSLAKRQTPSFAGYLFGQPIRWAKNANQPILFHGLGERKNAFCV